MPRIAALLALALLLAPAWAAPPAAQQAALRGDLAAYAAHRGVVVWLLHHGAAVAAADRTGAQPLHWALRWGTPPGATPALLPYLTAMRLADPRTPAWRHTGRGYFANQPTKPARRQQPPA